MSLKGGANFTPQELAEVLSHYNIGIIQQIKPLIAGNRKAPKQIIVSDRGRFLIKRRAKGKDDLYRVAFAHSVQQHLAKKNFPIAGLISTKDEKKSFLDLNNHIYELFEFINGIRFDGKLEAVVDCGKTLAMFHSYLKDFPFQPAVLVGNFHNSGAVRGHLKKIASEKNSTTDPQMRKNVEELMTLYNSASINVNQLGFDKWKPQIIHGDWHQGNMIFENNKVAAVIDFDSLKMAATMTDLSNGVLQFSIVTARPNPADWPDYLDIAKFAHFIYGYCQQVMLDDYQLRSIVDLMIETLIAEAVLPIAATGYFYNLSGAVFLEMILRKCKWLDTHRAELIEAAENILQNMITD